MKKSDIAMVVLISSISIVVAFFAAKAIFGDVYNGKTTIKSVKAITSEVVEPSKLIFHNNAINPTVKVEVDGEKSDK